MSGKSHTGAEGVDSFWFSVNHVFGLGGKFVLNRIHMRFLERFAEKP